MGDEYKYALLMGRVIDLLRRSSDAVEDQKAALRTLVDLTHGRSATLRVEGTGLTVDGVTVLPETPFLPLLVEQMRAHDLAEIRIAHRASALDLILLLRAIAFAPDTYEAGHSVEGRLREAKVTTVSVLTTDLDIMTQARRQARLTAALEESGAFMRRGVEAPSAELGVVSGFAGARYDEIVRETPSYERTLPTALRVLSGQAAGPAMSNELEKVQAGIAKALRANELETALEGVVALIDLEEEAPSPEAGRTYSAAIRRLLYDEALHGFAKYLLDELYAVDVVRIMRRAGAAGTKVLLGLLVDAPTFAERKAYMSALRQIDQGTDVVASMLSHHKWFVVRNVADLAGELRIDDAVPALGNVFRHEDVRVRRSVGAALAKIGTPAAVQYLRNLLRDPDPGVRLSVAREVSGSGLGALAMPLVNAVQSEQEPEVVCEYYRALGRIGTSDSVQALTEAVQPGGRVLGRRAPGPRLAAIDGLALAGGSVALAALRSLSEDRSKQVRGAARKALQEVRA